METEIYLLAVIPNQQIRLAFQELRRSVYRHFGAVSALVLDPVIPVAFFDREIRRDEAMRALTPAALTGLTAPRFSVSQARSDTGCIFFGLDETVEIEAVRACAARIGAAVAPSGLFPACDGIFVACAEDSAAADMTDFLNVELKQAIAWTSSRIGLYAVSFPGKQDEWWNEVRWGLAWQFPFRKSLSSVPNG